MSRARRRSLIVVGLFAFSAAYLIPVFPHFRSANEYSRWCATAGLVEHGSLEVSWSIPLLGEPMDTARRDDRLYTNKAPGLVFLAVPAYALARAVVGPPSVDTVRWTLNAMRLAAVTLPALLLAGLVARRCDWSPFAAASLCFASPLFVYGGLFFSHVTAAACLFAASTLALGRTEPPPGWRRDLAAGALCGLATVTEYTVAVGTLLLGAVLLTCPHRWRRVGAFVAGGAPFAVGLAAYNAALFGSPWSLSSANEAFPDLAAQAASGLYGIGLPSLAGLAEILASPSRGLLFFSPVLILGLVALVPRPLGDRAAWFRALLFVVLVLAIAGYPGRHGGWGVGARYLILVVPFLVEAAHRRGARAGFLGAALLATSVVLCVSPALTLPFAPNEFAFPHASFTLPLLAAGFVTPNLGYPAVPGPASLAPVVLAAAVALTVAVERPYRRAVAGVLVGTLVGLAVLAAPVQDTVQERALRAVILDAHFRPEGRVARLAAAAEDAELRAFARSMATAVEATRRVAPDDWPYLPSGRPAGDGASRD